MTSVFLVVSELIINAVEHPMADWDTPLCPYENGLGYFSKGDTAALLCVSIRMEQNVYALAALAPDVEDAIDAELSHGQEGAS